MTPDTNSHRLLAEQSRTLELTVTEFPEQTVCVPRTVFDYWRGLPTLPPLAEVSSVLTVITVARYLVGMVLRWWPWMFPLLVAEKFFDY